MDHVNFPSFWKEEPALWFAQVEAVFALNNITSDKDKYDYILCELPSSVLSLIKDLILDSTSSEFNDGKYQKIKKELVKRMSIAELEKEEMGLMKPSEYYKHLQEKADPRISENILQEIWLKKLPSQVNYVVCDMKECDIESICKLADTVTEYLPLCLSNKTAAVTITTANDAKLSDIKGTQFENIFKEILKLKMFYEENTSHLERIQAELYKFKLAFKENNARLENLQEELLQKLKLALISYNNCDICKKKSDQKNKDLDKNDSESDNDKSSISSQVEGEEESDNDTENIEPVTDEKAENNKNEAETDTLCWYHKFYGINAHNCLAPCNFKNKLASDLK